MKLFKRIISSSLAIMMLCTNIAFAAETVPTNTTITNTANNTLNFTDLNQSFWGYEYIAKMYNAGYVDGYPNGTFNPNGNITRAEFVKLANQVFKFTEKQTSTDLTDVPQNQWYYDYVLTAQQAGYISGYTDNTFRPDKPITREELAKILDAVNKFVQLPYDKSPSDTVSPWATEYVNKVLSNRIMSLDENNKFRAKDNATRAEACKVLSMFITEIPVITPPTGGTSGGSAPGGTVDLEELNSTMETVIRRLEKGTIPELTIGSEKQIEIINEIIDSMENYISDSDYDYETAAQSTYEKYQKLSTEEQDDLKEQIQLNNTTSDLLDLQEFFFPDMEL